MDRGHICLIPARGGSKRIPRKNIKLFCGRPMIAWAISAAIESGIFDRVIVSTDDEEIAVVSVEAGAEVPFIRSADLTGDHVGLNEVQRHAIEWLERQGEKPHLFTCVYATAAFLRPSDLVHATELLGRQKDAEFVISVGSYPVTPFQALAKPVGDRLRYVWPEFAEERTQDLPEAFFEAAQFVIGRTKAFQRHVNALLGWTIPYVLPRLLCQDIDSLEDWKHAEAIFEFLQSKRDSGS